MGPEHVGPELSEVLIDEPTLNRRIRQLADALAADYEGRQILFVGVLKGAVMFMADLARAMPSSVEMDFMAVSSYGYGTQSSGVVRILKDLDVPLEGRDVVLVEDIIDSGLTLSWLLRTLSARNPASLEVCALLRKRDALQVDVDIKYVGFDIPNAFVVGYGLDHAQQYRNLSVIATLDPAALT
ncbi:MAG: hypoxanthine phosphoribosyltransferase [Candidatus Nanopelagicales bacterium]